ncbi:hypothetical protein [Capnocytophaga sputigena]|uniref:hypothetical protein n=1 Tax=Capnocytophaga sputigena TaxID=1019 RepID=UPI0028F0537D|nr:hypothetical protein [Capnocytophaga sputigena]
MDGIENIKSKYNTIDKVIEGSVKKSNIISVFSVTAVIIMAVLLYMNNQKGAYILDNQGDIAFGSKVNENDLFLIEVDNHLRLFYARFFNYDKSNYKEQLELGLYLGGVSVKRLYETLEAKGWYSQMVNHDLISTAYIEDIQAKVVSNGVAEFYVKGIQIIKRGDLEEKRHLDIRGVVKKSPNGRVKFKNPHGMIIDNLVVQDNTVF